MSAIRYIAEVRHVREVSLLGSADLSFWRDRLGREGLVPAERDGRAQVLVVAAAMRFMGVRFAEVSFSVLIHPPEPEGGRDAAFLVGAFNSCRLLALCERLLFSTPYAHAGCRVSTTPPVSVEVGAVGGPAFRAALAAGPAANSREPSRAGEEGWEGPIFLPRRSRGKDGRGRMFFARLRGHTLAYPFLPSDHAVSILPSRTDDVFRALLDSGFVGREWAVRGDASHARTKTYTRTDVMTEPSGPTDRVFRDVGTLPEQNPVYPAHGGCGGHAAKADNP